MEGGLNSDRDRGTRLRPISLNQNIYRLVVFLDAVTFFSLVLAFATISMTSLYGCWVYVYRDGRAKCKPSSVLRENILVLKRWGVGVPSSYWRYCYCVE